MAKTGMYVGLDIGTTSVKVIVAEYVDSQMNIIGVGNAKSEGINRGIVVDIDKAVQAIQRAVGQAEEKAGKEYDEFNKNQKIVSDFDKLIIEANRLNNKK